MLIRTQMGVSSLLLLALGVASTGCSSVAPDEATDRVADAVTVGAIGDPLPGLTAAQLTLFNTARSTFAEVEGLSDGLGPVFNERSCGNCHNFGAVGGAGKQFEVRAGRLTGTSFDPLTAQGGSLFDLFSVTNPSQTSAAERALIPGCTLAPSGEPLPATVNVTALRRTTALFGLGLVDATPDSTFTGLALLQLLTVKGRAPLVPNIAAGHPTVGKFGWKSQNPTLHQFSGDAYLNEMGITNPEFPDEQAPSGNPALVAACDVVPGLEDNGDDVSSFTSFMSLLAPPPRASSSVESVLGDALFSGVGCDHCHVRALVSGKSPIAALSFQPYFPFSDFLLHKMGTLADDIGGNGTAAIDEMRTAPLWGLRFLDATHLLHDGRAHSIKDAILAHDGSAKASRDAFAGLSASAQKNLIAFLNTL